MKISIITATYNSLSSLPSVFRSIADQDYSNIEWIIVDGGSNDGTLEYIKDNESLVSKWVSEPDNGIYDALNKGLDMATGDIIGFLHSDDFFEDETVIGKIIGQFEIKQCDGVYGDLRYVNSNDTEKIIRYWKSNPFYSSLLKKGWMPAHPTLFLKKGVYQKHGSFDTSFKIAADYDFMLRILKDNTLKFEYLPEIITNMRVGGASNTVGNLKSKMREDLRAMANNKIAFPYWTLARKNMSKVSQFLKKRNKFNL